MPVWHLGRLIVFIALAAAAVSPASAQAPLTLDSLQIQLWPEYDRAEALVIVDGRLAAGTALPASLSVRIPASAGEPHAVAVRAADGRLLSADFTTAASGADIIVSFVADSLDFRIEYYDPALSRDGSERSLSFVWTTDYAVSTSSLRVQQPIGATGLTGDPALSSLGIADDNFFYYGRDYGALAAGDAVALSLRYDKPTNQLSAEALGAAEPAGVDSAPAAAFASNPNLPWIIGGGALGLGFMALGWLVYRRGGRPAPRRGARARHGRAAREPGHPAVVRRRHAAATRQSSARPRPVNARPPDNGHAGPSLAAPGGAPVRVAPAEPIGAQSFCTQCGHRLQPGDQFCRQCGAGVAAS